MLKFITSLPEQLEKVSKVEPPEIRGGPFKRVVFVGMGGSAVSGDIVRSLLYESPFSTEVIRDYTLPGSLDNRTLLILTSYSGNTEETISALQESLKGKFKIATITSNGKLEQIARENNLPLLTIPKGYPPRGALGWLLGSSLKILAGAGLMKDEKVTEDLIKTSNFLKKIIPEMEDLDSDTRELAEKLYLRIPLIYASQRFYPIAYRWQTQINENAKAFAHSHALSEMNHNEIAGLKNPAEKVETMWAIFISLKDDHERIKKRIDFTIDLIRDSILGYSVVKAKGDNTLQRVLYLILMGDFVSFYLAQAYQEDALSIPRIDMLKKKLSK